VKTPLSLFGLSSSFIDFSERHLTIGLSHDYKRFFRTYVLWSTLTLIAHLDLFDYQAIEHEDLLVTFDSIKVMIDFGLICFDPYCYELLTH
jgi:hypothetical protein